MSLIGRNWKDDVPSYDENMTCKHWKDDSNENNPIIIEEYSQKQYENPKKLTVQQIIDIINKRSPKERNLIIKGINVK